MSAMTFHLGGCQQAITQIFPMKSDTLTNLRQGLEFLIMCSNQLPCNNKNNEFNSLPKPSKRSLVICTKEVHQQQGCVGPVMITPRSRLEAQLGMAQKADKKQHHPENGTLDMCHCTNRTSELMNTSTTCIRKM